MIPDNPPATADAHAAGPLGAVLRRRLPWRTAAALSAAALHGPFVLMALYTFLLVPCDHCKKAAAMLAPVGPGLLSVEVVGRAIGFRIDDATGLILAGFISLVGVGALTAVVRIGLHWRIIGLTLAALWSSFAAIATLLAIRQ